MSRRSHPAAALAAVSLALALLGGCGGPSSTDQPADEGVSVHEPGDDEGLPQAHPAFDAHFTDPLYEDEADELAPFGSDEGWDLVHGWGGRRAELSASSTVRDLLEDDEMGFALDELDAPAEPSPVPEPGGRVDASVIVVGAGFTLMRLTGQIDDEGRELVLAALRNLADEYPDEATLERQVADVESFATG